MTVYSVTINGNTYTSDNNPTTGMGAGGYRTRFLTAIADVVAVASQVAANTAAAAIPASGKQVSTTPTANQIPCVASDGTTTLPGNLTIATTATTGVIAAINTPSSSITTLACGSTGIGVSSWINAGIVESKSSGGLVLNSYGTNGTVGSGNFILFQVGNRVTVARFDLNGHFLPETDNTYTHGNASKRISVVYAGTGTINTSDAREKTPVVSLTDAEIAAAKDLAKEIGSYQFLSAVEAKGAGARHHIGMTVQRAIEVMTAHGLDPFRYGFICHDEWDATETEPAGDRYSFRPHELLFFIARGFEARLAALEAK